MNKWMNDGGGDDDDKVVKVMDGRPKKEKRFCPSIHLFI